MPVIMEAACGMRGKIVIFGNDYDTEDGTCIRDYIHVSDLADAHIRAYEYLQSTGQSDSFNLGNGSGYSVKDVLDISREISGHNIKAKEVARRAGDPAILISDSQKASQILGWKPQYPDLKIIIQTAWEWHSSSGYSLRYVETLCPGYKTPLSRFASSV